MKRGKRRIQKVWILLNTTELNQTKHNPANSPINLKLTKLMREKVSRNERSRELQKKENPCKIQRKKKGLRLLTVTAIFYPKNNIANDKHMNNQWKWVRARRHEGKKEKKPTKPLSKTTTKKSRKQPRTPKKK